MPTENSDSPAYHKYDEYSSNIKCTILASNDLNLHLNRATLPGAEAISLAFEEYFFTTSVHF